MAASAASTFAQDLLNHYYWYAPEHEQYGRTAFYSQPSFSSGIVSVFRTERFRVLGVKQGWALLQFDMAGKAYVHLRVLRNMIYQPAASDAWHEFRRASVFLEEPQKIEATLKGPAAATPESTITDSKTPAWKRYKDSWGIKTGRPAPAGSEEAVTDSAPPRPVTTAPTTKPRSKYPLLTPLGSEQPQDASPADTSGQDTETPPPQSR